MNYFLYAPFQRNPGDEDAMRLAAAHSPETTDDGTQV
jgi:hypothetical protein